MQYLTLNTAIRFPKMSSKFPYSRYRVLYTNALKSYKFFLMERFWAFNCVWFPPKLLFIGIAAPWSLWAPIRNLTGHKKGSWGARLHATHSSHPLHISSQSARHHFCQSRQLSCSRAGLATFSNIATSFNATTYKGSCDQLEYDKSSSLAVKMEFWVFVAMFSGNQGYEFALWVFERIARFF